MNRDRWTYKKLGDIAEIVGGSTPKTNVEEYCDGDNYWVTPAEIGESVFVDKTNRTITDSAVKSCHLSLLPVGTVLLSSRAPIGKLGITTVPMYCNQGFKNIQTSIAQHQNILPSLLAHKMTLKQPKSSEPRFLANVQRYFADFPYFLCLSNQRLFTLETCCGYQYECFGNNNLVCVLRNWHRFLSLQTTKEQ